MRDQHHLQGHVEQLWKIQVREIHVVCGRVLRTLCISRPRHKRKDRMAELAKQLNVLEGLLKNEDTAGPFALGTDTPRIPDLVTSSCSLFTHP